MHHWAIARFDLGLSEADFWSITLAQLHALHERHAQAWDAKKMLFGILASVTANFSMCAPKKALQPSDFGLGPKAKSFHSSGAAISEEDQVNNLRSYFRGLAGKPPIEVKREIDHAE